MLRSIAFAAIGSLALLTAQSQAQEPPPATSPEAHPAEEQPAAGLKGSLVCVVSTATYSQWTIDGQEAGPLYLNLHPRKSFKADLTRVKNNDALVYETETKDPDGKIQVLLEFGGVAPQVDTLFLSLDFFPADSSQEPQRSTLRTEVLQEGGKLIGLTAIRPKRGGQGGQLDCYWQESSGANAPDSSGTPTPGSVPSPGAGLP